MVIPSLDAASRHPHFGRTDSASSRLADVRCVGQLALQHRLVHRRGAQSSSTQFPVHRSSGQGMHQCSSLMLASPTAPAKKQSRSGSGIRAVLGGSRLLVRGCSICASAVVSATVAWSACSPVIRVSRRKRRLAYVERCPAEGPRPARPMSYSGVSSTSANQWKPVRTADHGR